MTQKYQVKVSMKQAAIVETGIVLKQGDFGMQLEIEVLDFDVTGTTPQIVFRKAMGAVESTTITVSGNKYTYTFKGTELDTPGKVFCDLKLKNSTTQRISTASFMFKVVADTMDGLNEQASSYSDTIAQIVGGFDNKVDEVKSSLNYTDAIVSKIAGEAGIYNIEIPQSITKKELLRLKLFNGVKIRLTFTLSAAVGTNTYLYIEDKNGNNIYTSSSIVVLADQIVKNEVFTPAQDYDLAVIKYTTGRPASIESLVVTYESSTIKDIQDNLNSFYNSMSLDHATITSKSLERPKQMDNVLYECGSITGVTTATTYCGFTIIIDKPIIGKYIRAQGDRTGGIGNAIRINFFNESGTRIGSENWTTLNSIDMLVPEGTAKVNVTYASNWADSQQVGSTFTFDNVKIYYIDNNTVKINPDNITNISKQGEIDYNTANRLYKCDLFSATTKNQSYNGVTIIIDNPVVDSILVAKGKKNGGTGARAIRLNFLDGSGTRIGSENWTSGDFIAKTVPAGAKKAHVTYAANWGDAMTVGSNFSFEDIQIYYESLAYSIVGEGHNEYYGEPIVIKNKSSRINRCQISVWKDFTSDNTPNLADYCLFANQSMVIYKGYVFLFQQNNGQGQAERPNTVISYSTKNILSTFSLLPNEIQHANSAQFTDIYYDDNDEFPIMMLSRCGGAGLDECQLYRVTRSNDTFTFSLINKIYADYDTVGSSWGYDETRRIIYNMSKTNERGTDELLIVAWEMPQKSSIISGTSITLLKSNRIAQMYDTWIVYQGVFGYEGKLYCGTSGSSQNIYVYDVLNGRNNSRMALTSSREVEGVVIYNEKMYYTQKDDTDTTGINPLTIYEAVFNN